jgi:hypothetical protein
MREREEEKKYKSFYIFGQQWNLPHF